LANHRVLDEVPDAVLPKSPIQIRILLRGLIRTLRVAETLQLAPDLIVDALHITQGVGSRDADAEYAYEVAGLGVSNLPSDQETTRSRVRLPRAPDQPVETIPRRVMVTSMAHQSPGAGTVNVSVFEEDPPLRQKPSPSPLPRGATLDRDWYDSRVTRRNLD